MNSYLIKLFLIIKSLKDTKEINEIIGYSHLLGKVLESHHMLEGSIELRKTHKNRKKSLFLCLHQT